MLRRYFSAKKTHINLSEKLTRKGQGADNQLNINRIFVLEMVCPKNGRLTNITDFSFLDFRKWGKGVEGKHLNARIRGSLIPLESFTRTYGINGSLSFLTYTLLSFYKVYLGKYPVISQLLSCSILLVPMHLRYALSPFLQWKETSG